MRNRLILLVLLVLPGVLTAQQNSKVDKEIRAQVDAWEKAIAAKDTAAIRALHAKDAVAMPPNGKAEEGQDAIAAMWTRDVSMPGVKFDLRTTDVMASRSGDLAVESGTFTFEADSPQPGGAKMQDSGKYITIWQKQGGKWRVVRDIWNSDTPRPEM